ncbi:MAG: EF-hand domain-containing protein [Paracoccaceae bacterium]
MKPALAAILAFGLAAPAAAPVLAQDVGPGQYFVYYWDINEDGAVSLAEATERRDLFFVAFDADEDGYLSDDEYALLQEMREIDRATVREEMTAAAREQGFGKQKGKQRHLRMGRGFDDERDGLDRRYNDSDGDGRISHDEFVGRTADWFARMDRDGDGVITTADFGRN